MGFIAQRIYLGFKGQLVIDEYVRNTSTAWSLIATREKVDWFFLKSKIFVILFNTPSCPSKFKYVKKCLYFI